MTDEDAEVGGSAMADMTMEWIRFGLTEKEIMSRLRALRALNYFIGSQAFIAASGDTSGLVRDTGGQI